MEGHERIAYSALPERAPLHWPGGARVALWVAPNIEHYEYLPEQIRVRNPWPRVPHPDILGYGLRDYGNRVGVFRILTALKVAGVRATFPVNANQLERLQPLIQAILAD
eukprot:gene7442-9929_t